jgi:D-glycero-D-manno-heptose 1,7-bisphosphate phosphatase
MHKALFLDRDGTLMVDVGYCSHPDQVVLLPDVKEVLGQLKKERFKLVLITNQSGINRGYFTETDFWAVQRELQSQLAPIGIDATYFCPDYLESPRRKPAPGMILEAASDLSIDLNQSVMIGDKWSDVEAGMNAGVRHSIWISANAEAQTTDRYSIIKSFKEIYPLKNLTQQR